MPVSLLDGGAAALRQAVVGTRMALPGLALSIIVALAALLAEAPLARLLTSLFGQPLALPAMMIALLAGMAASRVAARPAFAAGIDFSIRRILRIAVALLGIRIAVVDIVALGPATGALVIVTMVLTLASGLWIGRLFGQTDPFGALAGSATAVCGASAALATATVLPRYPSKHADMVFVVVAVNALSTVAMIAYPALCSLLGFDAQTTGIMLGATIHDVAQVAGAGYAVSDAVGDNAVIVKLFRVLLLVPVVLSIAWFFAGHGAREGARLPIPGFALVFLGLVAVNSLGLVPAPLKTLSVETSKAGLLLAIAALGLATSFRDIVRSGWRQSAVVIGTTFVILVAVTTGLSIVR
jgi:uncharacterized integral membrane protein (TIGR00698 family)